MTRLSASLRSSIGAIGSANARRRISIASITAKSFAVRR
jgi:hypothetical protein